MSAAAAPLWPEGLSEISVFTVVTRPPAAESDRAERTGAATAETSSLGLPPDVR